MPKFLYVYHGGSHPSSPEEAEKVMAKWMSWMEGCGSSMVDGGNPVGVSKTVSPSGVADNGGANPASGYSIVSAETIGKAAEIARSCPILESGGSIEVAEIMEM